MHLLDSFKLSSALSPDKPILNMGFCPTNIQGEFIVFSEYGYNSKNSYCYDYYQEVINLIKPILFKNGDIKIVQIKKDQDPTLEGVDHVFPSKAGSSESYYSRNFYILSKSIGYFGNNNIYAHVAAFLEKPTICCFGPSSLDIDGPIFGSKVYALKSGDKNSFNLFEKTKTINAIKPEDIANTVLSSIISRNREFNAKFQKDMNSETSSSIVAHPSNDSEIRGRTEECIVYDDHMQFLELRSRRIENFVSQKTVFIGKKYGSKIVEYLPNFVLPAKSDLKKRIINVRLDLFNLKEGLENIEKSIKNGYFLNIITDKEIPQSFIKKYKRNIDNINVETSESISIDFLKFLKVQKISYNLYAKSKNIKQVRFKFIDYVPVHEVKDPEPPNKECLKAKYYKSSKILLSKGKMYFSAQDEKKGIPVSSEKMKIPKDKDFWLEKDHFLVYN